ncbi:MAG: hypothetical protein H7X76_01060 [Prolixibacteraceae bacterium]|nr:hypothetical protein [Burkholderiales bacterium]
MAHTLFDTLQNFDSGAGQPGKADIGRRSWLQLSIRVGLVHVVLVKIASTAVATRLGGWWSSSRSRQLRVRITLAYLSRTH